MLGRASLAYLVLVIDLDDDDGRVGLDVLPAAVNQDLVEDEKLVPSRRQSLVNDL